MHMISNLNLNQDEKNKILSGIFSDRKLDDLFCFYYSFEIINECNLDQSFKNKLIVKLFSEKNTRDLENKTKTMLEVIDELMKINFNPVDKDDQVYFNRIIEMFSERKPYALKYFFQNLKSIEINLNFFFKNLKSKEIKFFDKYIDQMPKTSPIYKNRDYKFTHDFNKETIKKLILSKSMIHAVKTFKSVYEYIQSEMLLFFDFTGQDSLKQSEEGVTGILIDILEKSSEKFSTKDLLKKIKQYGCYEFRRNPIRLRLLLSQIHNSSNPTELIESYEFLFHYSQHQSKSLTVDHLKTCINNPSFNVLDLLTILSGIKLDIYNISCEFLDKIPELILYDENVFESAYRMASVLQAYYSGETKDSVSSYGFFHLHYTYRSNDPLVNYVKDLYVNKYNGSGLNNLFKDVKNFTEARKALIDRLENKTAEIMKKYKGKPQEDSLEKLKNGATYRTLQALPDFDHPKLSIDRTKLKPSHLNNEGPDLQRFEF